MYVLLLYFPEGTRNVIEACIQQNVRRLIYASSVDVVKYKGDVVDGGIFETAIVANFDSSI